MKRFLFILGLSITISSSVFAQDPIVGGSVASGGLLNGTSSTISTFDLSESKKVSSFYVDDIWKKAEIWNEKGEKVSKEHFVRYDILNNELNFKIDKKEMVAPEGLVSRFVVADINGLRAFKTIAASNWKLDYTPFFEILDEGEKVQLLVLHEVEKVKPNYNPALDIGSKTETIKHREVLYLLDGKVLTKLPKKAKMRAKLLAKYNVKDLIKQHKLNLKDKNDMIKLVQLINQ